MPEVKANFASGLSYLIARCGIKQKQLAEDVGLKEQDISDYKAGRRKGNETERNRIAERLGTGLPEHLIRQLGMMIRNGVDGDEAFERVNMQAANAAANSDETVLFNRTLDDLFAQIKEFLRDEYGETLHVAVSFEEVYNDRMPLFAAWKKRLIQEFLDSPRSANGRDST